MDEWQIREMEKKLLLVALPLHLRESLDKRARGESKTFDTMLIALYLASLGFVGIWFGAAKDQIEQPKKYMKWIIENSFLKYMIASDGLLKESVRFMNGGELKLRNLTEMNARSSRADFEIFDEEAQADKDAYRAAVNILAGSSLGLVFHISTPTKASVFEENYNRLKRREIVTGEQFIFSHVWEDASWLRAKADWYAEQKKILPEWYFNQEHKAMFTHALGAVFKNVVYDVYELINNEWILKIPLVLDKRLVSGMDWNPVSGHWCVGGKWTENLHGFLVTHADKIAVGYSHELKEAAYRTIKSYAIHHKRLNMEDGGTNIPFVKWFKEWFGRDRAKRDVNVMYEEWDSQGINKTNAVLGFLAVTIYVDKIRFPELAEQIENCRWVKDTDKLEIEKDQIDSPHAFDAFLHSGNKKMLKDQGLRRFDWYGST